jgi:hypothetical protein
MTRKVDLRLCIWGIALKINNATLTKFTMENMLSDIKAMLIFRASIAYQN